MSKLGEKLRRARERGAATVRGVRGTATAAAVGGIVGYADDQWGKGTNNKLPQFFTDHWWAKGAVLVVGGFIIGRKLSPAAGLGMAGAGGALLAQGYDAQSTTTQTQPQTAGYDAGAVVGTVFGRQHHHPALGRGRLRRMIDREIARAERDEAGSFPVDEGAYPPQFLIDPITSG